MFVYKISRVKIEMKACHDDFGTYKSCSFFFWIVNDIIIMNNILTLTEARLRLEHSKLDITNDKQST